MTTRSIKLVTVWWSKRMLKQGLLSILLMTASLTHADQAPPAAPVTESLSATELAKNIRMGKTTSEAATRKLLSRIAQLDRSGPRIQSVISLNPDAISAAIGLDREVQTGKFRSPLHGVPILIKDNIETRELPTTAGSLALIDNNTGRDAPIVARLREAGMVILGKTNLSEWANYRSSNSISGWSGVGGLTKNPYNLRRSPCGSSSGSAAAVAAGFVPVALGTETNGSITCPAAVTGLVGMKPTVGLLSRRHIVPLSPRQDSAGPITKSVEDAAALLTLLAATDAEDLATHEADKHKQNYAAALDEGIQGMRIGVFRWAQGDSKEVTAVFNDALEKLRSAGATLVEIENFSPPPIMWREADRILKTEFKAGLNDYLANLPSNITARSMNDVIKFNIDNADRELALFDQSILIDSAATGSADEDVFKQVVSDYVDAARTRGVDHLLTKHNVRLLIMPTTKPAAPIDLLGTSEPVGGPLGAGWLASAAGYPVLTVPMGDTKGLPLGLLFMGTAWDDAALLRAGHAFEDVLNLQQRPSYFDGDFDHSDLSDLLTPYE